MAKETIELAVVYVHHTDDALLVETGFGERWVPRSVGSIDGLLDLKRDDECELVVEYWYAKKKGMI